MSLLDNLPHEASIYLRTRTSDKLGGNRETRTLVRSGVACWQQSVSTNEVMKYSKSNMSVTTKVYFTENPAVTDRHEIVITKRMGVAVPVAEQTNLQVLQPAVPDASAGLGVLFRVMGSDIPGQAS
jgi:hypothetical protein